ncbi:MAG TPA: histidine kinase [Agromyces sp.]|nr:histidine kinase [Agromyces sp.]
MQQPRQSRLAGLWRALPVIATAALAAAYLVGTAIAPEAIGATAPSWIVPVGVAVQALALAFRYRMPLLTFVATIVVDGVLLAFSAGELGIGTFAVMVAAYTVRRAMPARLAYRWLVAGCLASAVIAAVMLGSSVMVAAEWRLPFALLRALLAFGLPAVIAELVIARQRLVVALRDRAELAEREQARRATQAVQQERALIARELHDIAAHHLTGIIVSAQAAGSLLETDPERARAYLKTVGDEARTTLDNVRQTVGLLRVDDAAALTPVPSIGEIPALVDDLRARDAAVDLTIEGPPAALGPVAEVAAYRMVQESLANAARHAPGSRCTVLIEYAGSEVRLTVTNDAGTAGSAGAAASGGHGLVGMRERAALVGGTVLAGRMPGGGWRTRLVLPLPDPVPDAQPDAQPDTVPDAGGDR